MKKPANASLSHSPPILTLDLLLNILSRLSSDADRKSCRLVCKEFLQAEALLRRSLRILRHESLPGLLRLYGSLERLDLSSCPRIDDRTVSLLFSDPTWARRLRSLVLSRACGLRSAGLEVVARSCPCLEEVDVSHCRWFGDREASALSCATELRVLKLVKCLRVTDVGLAKIAVGCAGLEWLDLKWCLEISDLGIDLLCKKCRDLRHLDISYLEITNSSMCSIASMKKLDSLSMVGCSFVDDEGLDFLGNASDSLKIIDVSRCESVSFSGLTSVIKRHYSLRQIKAGYISPELAKPFLSKLKDLRSLSAISLDGFQGSHSILKFVYLNCPSLVEVGLSKCMGVTDESITELVSKCVNLRIIDLTCCHLLTDDALSAIADSCKKLKCLKLESCPLITEKGFDELGTCSLLQELDLTDCSINDSGLEFVSRCSELIDLKLGLCPNISDKGLFHIGSNCKELRELDLYRCVGIGDNGLAAIASGCRKLRKLNLCYCAQITDKGLKHLSGLEGLSDLELRSLLKISSVGLTAIAIGCKSLVELDVKRCYSIDDMALCALVQHSRNLRQINISYCPVSDAGLCFLVGNMRCLQDVKLVHLTRVSLEGFELALRCCWDRLKKLKLCLSLKYLLSAELIRMMQARGCRIRWINKPLVLL